MKPSLPLSALVAALAGCSASSAPSGNAAAPAAVAADDIATTCKSGITL
jgi:hypothetical protein